MQFLVLLKKELTSLFQQKAVIGTLLIPMIMIMSFGILPNLIGVNDEFVVYYLNEDKGDNNINLGNEIIGNISAFFEQNQGLKLKYVNNSKQFFDKENAIWIGENFTIQANLTRVASYSIKYSDTNIRAESIMTGVVEKIIESVVKEQLLYPAVIPAVNPIRLYNEIDVNNPGKSEEKSSIAFPLAYMAFLILILSGSSLRITGFTAERQASMMELLLASIKYRRELVLSKLTTAIIYGMLSVLSYVIGMLFVFIFQSGDPNPQEFNTILFQKDVLDLYNILIIFLLFFVLISLSAQLMITAQLSLGKEAGDRLGTMINFALSFVFYFGLIADPLSQSLTLIINPFYWPYRISINLIFGQNYLESGLYILLISIFTIILLRINTKIVEREKLIFG